MSSPSGQDASTDGHLERWSVWIEVIFQHITELYHDRAIWHQLRDILIENKDVPEPWFFLDWTSRLWASSMAVGIRRLSDTRSDVVSLARLIKDVEKHPGVLTRDHHRGLYRASYLNQAHLLRMADESYDTLLGHGQDELTSSAISEDLIELTASARSVRHHVNKYVAHTDDQVGPTTTTYADLDHALDGAWKLYHRYSLLVTGSAPSRQVPVMQEDWTKPFLVAWCPNDRRLGLLKQRGIVPRTDT